MIDRDEVRRIAGLANIELDDAAVEAMSRDLSQILDYVDQIAAVEVPSSEAAPAAPMTLRDDEVGPSVPVETIDENAPAFAHGLFVVPKIIGGEP